MISKKITPAEAAHWPLDRRSMCFSLNSSYLVLILAYLTDGIHVGVASGVNGILKGLKYILTDFTEVISSGLGEFQITFYQILGAFCQVFCVVTYTLDVADTVK